MTVNNCESVSRKAKSPVQNIIRPMSTIFGFADRAYIKSPTIEISNGNRMVMYSPFKVLVLEASAD
jgi:hypothetical protein